MAPAHPIDVIEDKKDVSKVSHASVKSSELAPAQTNKRTSALSSDILVEDYNALAGGDCLEIPELDESLNDPGEKINYNINSNRASPRLPGIKINVPDSDEDLEFDEDVESLRIWSLVDEDLSYIASQKFSEHDKISPIPNYELEDESNNVIPKLPNIKVDSVERVLLKESESVAKEVNDTNLNESINDPGEKIYYNINYNSVSLRLSDIKIDVPLEESSLKVSESINIKYSDKNINSVSDVPNLPNIKVGVMTEAALSEERYIKNENLIQSQNIERVSLKESESVVHEYNDTNLDESLNDPNEMAYYNMTPNIVNPRWSGIKIDVPMKKLSMNVTESKNTKCSERSIISNNDVTKLPNIKIEMIELSNFIVSEYINANLNDSVERISLKESETVNIEYNDTNLNDQSEKVYYNINSNIVSPKLSGIKIVIPMEKYQ